MAINKNGGKSTPNSTMADAMKEAGVTENAAPQTEPTSSRGPAMTQEKSLLNTASLFAAMPLHANAGGDIANGFVTKFREIVTEKNAELLKSLQFDTIEETAMTAIVVQLVSENTVSCFNFIVEGSSDKLPDRTVQLGGGAQATIDTTAGDVYRDQEYWPLVHNKLIGKYADIPNVRLLNVGGDVLPTALQPNDPNAKRNIEMNITNAVNACYTLLSKVAGRDVVINTDMINTKDTLVAQLKWNAPDAQDASGRVIRGGISIALNGILNTQGSGVIKPKRPLTTLDCFIDLERIAPVQQPGMYPQQMHYPGMPAPTQGYKPRVTITNIESGFGADTLELQLLAISTASLLTQNNAWFNAFKPVYAKAGKDIKDIGAIGCDIDFQGNGQFARIDTKADVFNDQAFGEMMLRAFNPSLFYSIDVPEAGNKTWLQDVFIAAADNNQRAIEAILNAANNLTKGAFQNIYKGGNPMLPYMQRVHLGHYVDEDGTTRDIRNLDLLAMLNLYGDTEKAYVENFAGTYEQAERHEATRLQTRAEIIRNTFSNAEITGAARRLIFADAFMQALVESIAATGLLIRPEGIFNNHVAGVRGNPALADMGVGQNLGAGMFQAGGTSYRGGNIGLGGSTGGFFQL